ncbi:MAG: preprotein translocase subunit SecE [Flavobacteriales bacterium]|nr:preprotein translocase subunit SecE [Flavobacteriales bacterium]NNK80770.1 preprotein translocase subunit SecE [Flavobacteriales bacterium]
MAGIKTYFEESYGELMHKVSWPTWKELQSSAIVVLIASAIIALLVFLMDYVFGVNSGADRLWDGLLGLYYNFIG